MSPLLRNGFLVAALHVAIVASLGGKLMVDRATRPRVWARAAPVDPNLPIRGRYVSLRLEVTMDRNIAREGPVTVSAQNGELVARLADGSSGLSVRAFERAGQRLMALNPPVAYFIPEHIADPSRRLPEEELWVEVTVPRRGAPRPIRLGVKKDGALTPLELN